MNSEEFIDTIIKKIDELSDAKGIEKALLIVEIVQMLNTLKNGIVKQDKAHEAEKQVLRDQIDELNKILLNKRNDDREIVVGGQSHNFDLTKINEEVDSNGH